MSNNKNSGSVDKDEPNTTVKALSIKDSTLVDDRNNKRYRIRRLNNLWWMIDNLNYPMKGTLFKNNIYIGTGSYCYDDDPENCEKYGQLYDYPSAKEACPKGWRLPTKNEWKALNDKYKNCNPSIDGGIRHEVPLYEPIGGGMGNAKYRRHKTSTTNKRKKLSYSGINEIIDYWCAADEEIPTLKMMVRFSIEVDRCKISLAHYKPKEYLASQNFLSCRCVQEAK